jgi:RNA polymerase sigma-70 factor (ECF subfamily)
MEHALHPLYRCSTGWAWLFARPPGEGMALAEQPETAKADVSAEEAAWLERFWAGDKPVIEEVYREHAGAVLAAAGRILTGADQETVAHEVFFRLVSEETFRRRYAGGSLRAWLSTVSRNRAIDFYRRKNREEMTEAEDLERHAGSADADRFVERAEARRVVERFRKEVLPQKWAPVFEARFIKQLSQREAAAELALSRTTLAYQEMRIRSLLKGFLLNTTEEAS